MYSEADDKAELGATGHRIADDEVAKFLVRIVECRHAAEAQLDHLKTWVEALEHAYEDKEKESDSRGEEIVRLKAELKAIRRKWLQLNASSG